MGIELAELQHAEGAVEGCVVICCPQNLFESLQEDIDILSFRCLF